MTVFISRPLTATSAFRRLLTAQGWPVTGRSLVTLTALPFAAVPEADWIFFSSQNAVRFFSNSWKKKGYPWSNGPRWAPRQPKALKE